jgi:hypothetical protein
MSCFGGSAKKTTQDVEEEKANKVIEQTLKDERKTAGSRLKLLLLGTAYFFVISCPRPLTSGIPWSR